jgi:hypothetical protein
VLYVSTLCTQPVLLQVITTLYNGYDEQCSHKTWISPELINKQKVKITIISMINSIPETISSYLTTA